MFQQVDSPIIVSQEQRTRLEVHSCEVTAPETKKECVFNVVRSVELFLPLQHSLTNDSVHKSRAHNSVNDFEGGTRESCWHGRRVVSYLCIKFQFTQVRRTLPF